MSEGINKLKPAVSDDLRHMLDWNKDELVFRIQMLMQTLQIEKSEHQYTRQILSDLYYSLNDLRGVMEQLSSNTTFGAALTYLLGGNEKLADIMSAWDSVLEVTFRLHSGEGPIAIGFPKPKALINEDEK